MLKNFLDGMDSLDRFVIYTVTIIGITIGLVVFIHLLSDNINIYNLRNNCNLLQLYLQRPQK